MIAERHDARDERGCGPVAATSNGTADPATEANRSAARGTS